MNNEVVRKILVLELWNIGDVILTLPFLQQLRLIFPNARTTMVGRGHARELLAPTGLVDEFIVVDLNWQRSSSAWNALAYPWRELRHLGQRLSCENFDIAFQCRPHVREYVILALSGAKRRVGVRKKIWDRLLTDRLSIDALGVQKKNAWLQLLEPFGGQTSAPRVRLQPAQAAQTWVRQFLTSHGISTETVLIGVHPGASVLEKRWPIDRFAEVVDRLCQRPDARTIVFIDAVGYGSSLSANDGRILVQQGLPELVALLECCDLLVCNDSGPMHIAGALGIPCVAVFSSGIDRLFEPLGDGHRVITSTASGATQTYKTPPAPYNVSDVPVSRVLDAIDQLIG